jgi:PAS domain S-box-containing protein
MNKNRSKIISISAAVIIMLPCVMLMIGWLTHRNFLRSVVPGTVTMKFNAALAFVISSSALLLRYFPGKNKIRYKLSVLLCALVFLIGLITFAEYFFGFNIGIDELFVKDNLPTINTYYPGRMSPLSAMNFLLIGIGLLLLNRETTATYQFFYLSGIAFISLLMLLGFNFIADIPTFLNLSIYEAIGFVVLPAAIYFTQPMLQKRISFEQKLFTGFTTVIILIAALSIFSSYYNARRISTSQWVNHTNDVLDEVQQISSLTKDIESEDRGYIITGDSNYRRYFMIAKDNIFKHYKELKELTKDNSSERGRIDSLSALIEKQIDFSLQCFRAKNENGFEAAKALMASRQGMSSADAIRKETSEIQQEENNLLIQRQKESDKSIISFNRAFFVLLASIFILLVIILFSFRYNIGVRKKAEAKITESAGMFSTLFYRSPVLKAIIEVSTGKYIDVNDAFVNFSEYTKEEILGKSSIEANLPGLPEERRQIIKNIQRDGFVRELEMQFNSKNGKASWVSTNIDLVNLNGKDCFLSTGTDITKRKIAEENLLTLSEELESIVLERTLELNTSEKRYRYLFENNPMPMWIIDLNTFQFLDVNEMAILQYGYSRQEFLSMTAVDIRPDEDKDLFKQSDHSFKTGSTNYKKGIWNHRKKDGTIIQVEVIGHHIIFEGILARFILSNDVTERMKAIEKLDKSEKLFRAMIEKDTDMKTLSTKSGKVFYASPSLTKILGFENQEFMSMPAFDLIHPADRAGFIEGITDIVQTPGKSFFHQQRMKHKNGTWLWCEGTIANMLHEPAVEALVSNFRDITARKQAEEDIKLAETNYREIFDKASDAIYVREMETWKVIEVNQIASKITGYTREELLNSDPREFITGNPDYTFQRALIYLQKAAAGEPQLFEWMTKNKDSSINWIEISLKRATIGGKERILSFFREINDRKKIQLEIQKLNEELEQKVIFRTAELQKSNELFYGLFNHNPSSIDISNINDGKLIDVNDGFLQLNGYSSKEEVVGKTTGELHMSVNPAQRAEIIRLVKENKYVKNQEINTYDKHGNEKWIQLSAIMLEVDDVPCLFSVSIDITKRMQAEEQLKLANKELEAFSYSVSHDLRAPLRAINGFAKKLEENYNTALDNEGKRLLDRIKVNAIKMGFLIDDLLEFSRLGKKEIHKSHIQMTELVEATLLEINTTIHHEAAVKIHQLHSANADSTMIKQVMINLLSNAIKYSSKTERPSVEVKSYLKENEIVYSVTDNGAGFNNQFAHKLFGVFQRLHLQADFEGTGVGLALVKRIINKHGGRVWAAGELNKGATFCFTLPATNNN